MDSNPKSSYSIYKNDSKTMTDMLYWATKYTNAKDVVIAREGKSKKREKHDDPRSDKGRKVAQTGDRRDKRRLKPPPGRMTNFTLLKAPLD